MSKLILLSIILFTVIVPIAMSKRSSPKRTLRSIQIATFVATWVWAYACRVWYPQLVTFE